MAALVAMSPPPSNSITKLLEILPSVRYKDMLNRTDRAITTTQEPRMARFFTLIAGLSLFALMLFAAGCQTGADVNVQATLPPPNFNTPTIQERQAPVAYQPVPVPRPTPAPVAARPVAPAPHR